MATKRKAVPRRKWAEEYSDGKQLKYAKEMRLVPYCYKPDGKHLGSCCHAKVEKGNKCDFCYQFFRLEPLEKPDEYFDMNIDRW